MFRYKSNLNAISVARLITIVISVCYKIMASDTEEALPSSPCPIGRNTSRDVLEVIALGLRFISQNETIEESQRLSFSVRPRRSATSISI